ncbi:radical SAM protein [Candidatus Kuenenbacteria bacterium]|nr:radical SAM protein [Candidatus Kuenenbacteria bacterium]
MHIETTYRCTSDPGCVFCYNPLRGVPFNETKMDKIIQSIYDSWVPHVYLIGGEPSLLGVGKLNQYINLLARRSSITIVTNGLIYLQGLSRRLACIGIPIHGNKTTHERHTRFPGGYDKTIENIRQYIQDGFDVRCIPVLTAWNYDQVYEVIKLASQLGMESVFVDRYEDGGLGSQMSNVLKPSLEQFQIALGQMIKARDDFGMPVGFGTAIPFCLDPRLITENMHSDCGAGITFAAVNPDGDVRVCNQSIKVYGNVLLKPIEAIWQSKELQEFRDLSWVTEPCRSCPVLSECLCGCKVDCSQACGFCVDYAVRGLNSPPNPLRKIRRRALPITFPKPYRRLMVDNYTILNTFHRIPYLITRYQAIRIDETATEIIRFLISSGQCAEEILVGRFSEEVEEPEFRSFVSKLIEIGAVREVVT